jgi:Icc-related predicted phosphoesterase
MKLCIISDTHGKHKLLGQLPEGEVIIHAGDFTSVGHPHEIVNFMKWYTNLNYKYKIIIAGNHDWMFERDGLHAKELIPENIIYLEDNGIEIEGINFWGTPVSKPFCNWAFNRPEEKLAQHWAAISENTDVLITHSPPYMIGDYVPRDKNHHGSPSLYKEVIERIKPQVHIFGHIHEGNGIKVIENTTFINASNLDGDYMCVFNPIIFDVHQKTLV